MKKILLAFDGTHFSEGAFELARKLNKLDPILLTGAFLPQAQFSNLWSYADSAVSPYIPLVEKGESELVLENISRFEKLCRENSIDYRVHKDFYDFALPELKRESLYADLLILGTEVFFHSIDNDPNEFLLETLHDVKCPVLLVPEKFEFPESILLAYDGSESSVYAIKQFAYLFPEFRHSETLLVYADPDAAKDFPDKVQIEELATRHFRNLTLFKLDLDPKKYFKGWVADKRSAMLVCGSFGRSGVSQLFKKSFVKDIIDEHRLPVFIAHK